jgi:hypothetical protein
MSTERIRRVMRKEARESYVADLRDGRKHRAQTFRSRKRDAAHRRHWKQNKERDHE